MNKELNFIKKTERIFMHKLFFTIPFDLNALSLILLRSRVLIISFTLTISAPHSLAQTNDSSTLENEINLEYKEKQKLFLEILKSEEKTRRFLKTNRNEKDSILFLLAMLNNSLLAFEKIISYNEFDVNTKGYDGVPLIHLAVMSPKITERTLKKLLEHPKIDLSALDDNGDTVFHAVFVRSKSNKGQSTVNVLETLFETSYFKDNPDIINQGNLKNENPVDYFFRQIANQRVTKAHREVSILLDQKGGTHRQASYGFNNKTPQVLLKELQRSDKGDKQILQHKNPVLLFSENCRRLFD